VKRAVLVLVLSSLLAVSCRSEGEPPGIYGEAPPMEDYRANVGAYESLADLSDKDYRAAATKYREHGLEAFSTTDRESLLLIAQAAFLAYADTLRYLATREKPEGKPQGLARGRAVLEESYEEGRFASLVARRVTGKDTAWPWTVEPRAESQAPSEHLEFYGIEAKQGTPSRAVTLTVWDKRSQWTCTTVSISEENWSLGQMAHVGVFADYARGDLVGQDSVEGRAAYQFRSKRSPGYVETTYWLDAETLWLRQYEYEEGGIRYVVKLEAVNEDIRIEPPDVDVECIEEETE
jgi:hypothetical protein